MVTALKLRPRTISASGDYLPHMASQLDRFKEPYRSSVRKLVAGSRGLEDLLFSFPGLAFALATGFGTPEHRRGCLALVMAGASLRDAAELISLPWWLRKLPPEAFAEPLGSLPGASEFARRITNHIPAESSRVENWLQRVRIASDLAGEEFALWLAARTKAAPKMRDMSRIVLLSAWAWYGGQPGTVGHRLVRKAFEPTMGFRKAVEEADHWKKRIDLAVVIGDGIRDCWYPPGRSLGYEFVPLTTLDSFLDEARHMDNCLDQYGLQVSLRNTRVFSVRKNGAPVADVEIGPHDDDCSMPAIEQLRGPANRRVPPSVWQATYAWLSSQTAKPLLSPKGSVSAETRAVARRIWAPFLKAIAGSASEDRVKAFLRSGEVLDPQS